MDRHLEAAYSASPPSAPAASPGYPTNGNPQTATPATEPGEWWFHMLTEEIRNVITGAGLTPDHTVLNQLTLAIQSMIVGAQKAVIVHGVTFEASVANGEAVRWDSGNSRFDEAIADGTASNRAVGVADVTNSKVYLYGECPLFSGLTPGARYYLDASTAGALTATAPADRVQIGIAKSATVLWVDIDAAVAAAPRLGLTANITLYVAITGNDSNNGLSAGAPFLTIQKAIDVLHDTYDLNGYVATVQVANGTYAAGASASGPFAGAKGGGSVVLLGNAGTPASVIINGSAGFGTYAGAAFTVNGFAFSGNAYGLLTSRHGRIAAQNISFGALTASHIYSEYMGEITITGAYAITGGAQRHFYATSKGIITANSSAPTLTGTPAFSNLFAEASNLGGLDAVGMTITGAATGKRYQVSENAVIYVAGGGANYFPGSIAGTVTNGGQYV